MIKEFKDGEIYGQNSQNFSKEIQDFSSANRKKILPCKSGCKIITIVEKKAFIM